MAIRMGETQTAWVRQTFGGEMPLRAWELLDNILDLSLEKDQAELLRYLRDTVPTLRRRDIPREDGRPYMTRYDIHGWMPADGEEKKYARSIYLHNFHTPDYDEAPHNHPWIWAHSLVLTGGYLEKRTDTARSDGNYWLKSYRPGDVNDIDHDTFHVVKELDGETWTLFSAGQKTSSWGFWLPDRGVVPWRDRMRERGLQPPY